MLFKPGLTTAAAVALATLLAGTAQIDAAQAHAKKHHHYHYRHHRHPMPNPHQDMNAPDPVTNGGHDS